MENEERRVTVPHPKPIEIQKTYSLNRRANIHITYDNWSGGKDCAVCGPMSEHNDWYEDIHTKSSLHLSPSPHFIPMPMIFLGP